MPTLKVEYPKDLLKLVGRELGPSEWMTVDQSMIDKFAEATGDHQWIHVDVERAKREMPGGKTIAHGYLTLALVPRMAQTLVKVTGRKRGLNYGSNKVRFTNAVPAGSRIRLRSFKLKSVEPMDGNGYRVTSEATVEGEGRGRPARGAEIIGVRSGGASGDGGAPRVPRGATGVGMGARPGSAGARRAWGVWGGPFRAP